MGKWKYIGVTKDGKKERGAIEAQNEKNARRMLRAKGIRIRTLTPPSILEFDLGEYMVEKGIAKPFGQKELSYFTKQLAVMINAGVPILQALEISFKSQKNLALKKTIQKVAMDVGEGKSVSEALENQKGFDKLYCNLVRAGEAGGILDTILVKLADHMERQEKTKAQIKSAMTYPFIVTLVGIGVIWGLMVFVVPQFVSMLEGNGQEVPWVTQTVVDISDFLGKHSITMVPGFIVLCLAAGSWIKTPTGKFIFDRVMMKAPIFGGIIIKGNLGSFCRTLATMLSAGVSLIDSLDICIETIDNGVISEDLKTVKKKVVEGKSITQPLGKLTYFPEMITSMVRVGEQTGQVDQMLEKVSEVLEEEVNELVANMTKLIEPLIIVVLGGIIAFILVAMYLPIFMSAGGAEE